MTIGNNDTVKLALAGAPLIFAGFALLWHLPYINAR